MLRRGLAERSIVDTESLFGKLDSLTLGKKSSELGSVEI